MNTYSDQLGSQLGDHLNNPFDDHHTATASWTVAPEPVTSRDATLLRRAYYAEVMRPVLETAGHGG